MAIKKSNSINVAQVAQAAKESFVQPRQLATNEETRTQIVKDAPALRSLRKVCIIEKKNGFSFFTTEDNRDALDFIAYRNKFEKQNVVRAALNAFLTAHYRVGFGLDDEGIKIIQDYEDTIYRFE